MTPLTIPEKAEDSFFEFEECNEIVSKVNELVAAVSQSGVSARAIISVSNKPSGESYAHGLGTALDLSINAYFLEARCYAANGDLIQGVRVTKSDADTATLTYADVGTNMSATIVFDATRLPI